MKIAVIAGLALVLGAAPADLGPDGVGPHQARAQTAPAQGERALVASIQELLSALGYDAGTADGVAGQRTRRAIASFQRQSGMAPDGKPSEALYARLTLALNQGSIERPSSNVAAAPALAPSAAANAGRVEISAAPPLLVSTEAPSGAAPIGRWRIADAGGGAFEIEIEAAGRIGGNATARFWRWERDGDRVRIVYDNEWGGRVVRTGRLTDGRITGTAEGTGGRKWTWSADRVQTRADVSAWRADR